MIEKNNNFDFQLYSDIHLEFYKDYPRIPQLKKYLILAGDIGKINSTCFQSFLDYCNSTWEKTFYVLGNHEYYHSRKTYDKLNQEYKELFETYNNIELLDRKKILFQGWEILGCTLWSHYSDDLQDNILSCLDKIKKKDKKQNRNITIDKKDYNMFHLQDKEWLQDNYNPEKKSIIITHYPTRIKGVSHTMYNKQTIKEKQLFANNINFIPNKDVSLICIAGHTHFSYDFTTQKNIRYISNQFGYKDELKENITNFNPFGCYSI